MDPPAGSARHTGMFTTIPVQRADPGIQSECKDCRNDIQWELPKEQRQLYSKRSREKNLERNRLLGRAKQRRRRGKLSHDVPKEYKGNVLKQTRCFYCDKYIEHTSKFDEHKILRPNFRTIDHKIPVSRGVDNSPENLVMACNRCNASKCNKTTSEFIAWRQRNLKEQ